MAKRIKKIQNDRTVDQSDVNTPSNVVLHSTHYSDKRKKFFTMTSQAIAARRDVCQTYMLSSRHILGPTTLAAPLVILKAKWFSGQGFERPHLWWGGLVAGNDMGLY